MNDKKEKEKDGEQICLQNALQLLSPQQGVIYMYVNIILNIVMFNNLGKTCITELQVFKV